MKYNNTYKSVFLLFQISLLILGGCQSYVIQKKKVYYVHWNEATWKNKDLIDSADSKTFKRLKHRDYAKDKNYVYYEWKIIKGADPKSFKSILGYYGKDDFHGFYADKLIEGSTGKTFRVLDKGPYSTDGKDYYYKERPLHVSDYSSVKILSDIYVKDKNFFYLNGYKHPLADYETFTELDNSFTKDKFQVYFEGEVVEGADPATIRILEYP